MRDLLVVGGGPVGLAAALHAAEAGLDTCVRERRAGVVDKACGEGLMPGAVAALRELGVPLEGHRLRGIRYVDGRRSAETAFGCGSGLGVRRTALHAALRGRAAERGVEMMERPVRELAVHADHVRVDGEAYRYVVAADGLHSPVRDLLGLRAPSRGPRRWGQRVHVEVAPWTDLVEVHWGPTAEAYVTPVSSDQVGVAVLGAERRPLDDLLGQFPGLRARIAGRPTGAVRGAGPLRQRSTRRVAGRVLLVGDAAGYVDALTGEGIALGVAEARAAVSAVVAGDPAGYERAWRRLRWRHELLTSALLGATRSPFVRRHLVGVAAGVPRVFGAVVDQLARPA